MATHIHETINGLRLEYPEPTDELRAFLGKVIEFAASGTEDDLVALVYSDENPLLEPSPFGGRGIVTRDVLDNPVWTVLMDLLERKRLEEAGVDPEALAQEYTVSVPDAAGLAGVHQNAIRQAIQAGRLAAWKHGREYRLHPKWLAQYIASLPEKRRGPAPAAGPLEVCFGSAPGLTFGVKGARVDVDAKRGRRQCGKIAGWRELAIGWGGTGDRHFRIVRPAGTVNEIAVGPFYVRGRFQIVQSEDDAAAAGRAWKEYE